MNKRSKNIENIIILFFFLSLLFVNNFIEVTNNHGVPFVACINIKSSLVLLCIGCAGLFFSMIKKYRKGFKLDEFSKLLLLRFFLFAACSLVLYKMQIMNTKFQFGIILGYFLSFCFFVIGSSANNKKIISKILFMSIYIILYQSIVTYLGRGLSYSNSIKLKWWMVIPIGQTNCIGCYLMGMYIYTFNVTKDKKVKIATSIMTLIGILLTYSRSGLIMYGLFMAYLILKDLKKNNYNMKLKVLIIIIEICCIFFVIALSNFTLLKRFSFDSLTSARFKVYKDGIQLFNKYPIIGIGAYKFQVFDSDKAHNWILEAMIENGLVGAGLLIFIIIKVLKKTKKYSPELIVFIIMYLLHGMVEPNLFTVCLDSFFWLLIGSCIYKKYN